MISCSVSHYSTSLANDHHHVALLHGKQRCRPRPQEASHYLYIIAKEQEARWMKKHALVKGADEI